MDAALNTQLQEGKPELLRRGASLFGSVYYLDPAITGLPSLPNTAKRWLICVITSVLAIVVFVFSLSQRHNLTAQGRAFERMPRFFSIM